MLYTIENNKIKAVISDLGATLVKFIHKNSDTDIVLGFEEETDYIKYADTNIGASIGRNANRIKNARFVLNNSEYLLSANENKNQLHGGGVNGFAFKKWDVKEVNADSILLTYFSKDLEEGFPGNLEVEVKYEIKDDYLIWSYKGISDKDTVLNMTNHSYFNLNDETILDEYLLINTDKYSPIDEESITLDKVLSVEDTPYDYRQFKKIKDNLCKLKTGIDNNYVYENFNDKLMAVLKNDKLILSVYSDLPDMHVYTSYYLNNQPGKYQKAYVPYKGICLECQYYPNSINYDNYLKPILRKGEVMTHYIKYQIKENKDGV